jgi:catechol 2,3-dioxygenase-like lactoylglutathione lyase family enzyme
LQFESADPDRLSRFYADAMNMRREIAGNGFLCSGPGRKLLVVPGARQKLGYAGFACREPEGVADIRDKAAKSGISILPSPSPLFEDGALAVRDPDGNQIVFGMAKHDNDEANGMHAPLQHLTLATFDVAAIEDFYANKLGFLVSDRVINDNGEAATCFMRSNHEHHTLACFKSNRQGIDHHSYEAGEWIRIRDWCDRFGAMEIPVMWGPGRHGPGNNLFVFIEDPDGNWIEVSAELEVIHDLPVKHWPHGERTLNYWGRAILRS